METWAETACAVANRYRHVRYTPAQAAVACVQWGHVLPPADAKSAADAAARLAAGNYDDVIRRFPATGGDHVR